jgi:hypothetical protein
LFSRCLAYGSMGKSAELTGVRDGKPTDVQGKRIC